MSKVEVSFKEPEKVVFVRPGQTAIIKVEDVIVEIRGIDHNPFKSEDQVEPKPDLHVFLRPGEMYSAKREDGTILKVSGVER